MSEQARHYCRNPRCRSKLPAPVENHHHAFCSRGCYSSFFLRRCRVCERPLDADPMTGAKRIADGRRKACGRKCASVARSNPRTYRGLPPRKSDARSAHFTGLKSGLKGDRPPFRCLGHYCWGGDPDHGDHSLYDKDGLTVARIVLQEDGRYHLRSPVTWPRMSWPDLDEARHRAETLALAAIPLESFDPKLAARIKRDNETPHPMGPPLNRQPSRETATPSDWKPSGQGIAPEIRESSWPDNPLTGKVPI